MGKERDHEEKGNQNNLAHGDAALWRRRAAGVAVVTALPVAGAVGTITAAGASVASVAGGLAGAADYVTREG